MMQTEEGRTGSLPPEWQNLATKTDLAEIHSDVADLRSDVADLRTSVTELRTRMEFMATKEDLAELRGEFAGLRAEFSGLRASLRTAGWFAGLVVGLLAVLVQIGLFFLQRSLG